MARGMFRTRDGLAMVEYGKHQGAISQALYKANGYYPVYEKLKQEPTHSADGDRKSRRVKKTDPVRPSQSQCQNWLCNGSKDRIGEAYEHQLRIK
jgi:hypothetical protein